MLLTPDLRPISLDLPPWGEVRIPAYHLDSGGKGPALLIHAVRHGNEVSGAEVARRFLERARRELRRGRVVVVPVANPVALWQRQYRLDRPEDSPLHAAPDNGRMGRWPGDPEGDEADRIVYALCQGLPECDLDVVVDLHCSEPAFASWAYERENCPPSQQLAAVSGFRFVRVTKPIDWTPPGYFNATGRAGLTLELSGTFAIYEREVRRGLRACLNVARHLGLMDGSLEHDGPSVRVVEGGDDLVALRAPMSGLYAGSARRPGDYVGAGEAAFRLLRESDWRRVIVRAPVGGYLHTLGPNRPGAHNSLQAQHAYVAAGEVLAEIAPYPPPASSA